MTDSARRGGQQARARVRPLDRWPQLRPDDRGCGKVNRRVDVPRLQIELLGPGGTRCSGLPVGWWTQPARYRVPPRARRWARVRTRSRPASRPTRRPAQPTARRRGQSAPRSGSALPRLRPSSACSMTPRGRPAAGAPVRQRHDVGNSLGFWFQDRRSTARRSDRLTNRDPALPALTDCAHGTDNLAWKSH